MSDFFKKFLVEDARRLSPSGRFVGLAAFGKHPGWDDHVEDLGLETDSLILAKTLLYVNGIGGQIDAGVWEKLDAPQQLPAFKHLFLWQRGGQFLLGRLWSSSDGKGRTRYPLVVCLHFVGVTLGWALKQALPVLAELEEGLVKAGSAEEVRALLNRKRAALRDLLQSTDGRGEFAPVAPETLYKILQATGDAKSEGFLRVLYQIQSQLGTFAAGKFNARANPAALRAQQIRVPAAGENPEQALLFWTRFFLTHVDASVPLLLTLPLDAGWLDVTAGEPESHEFFCLRASPKAVPLVSEVPYKLDDVFSTKATAFLARFKQGETKPVDLQPAAAPTLGPPAPARRGWLKWFGVGLIGIIGVVAAIFFLPKSGEPPPKPSPPEPKSELAGPVAKTATAPAATAEPDPAKTEAAREKARTDALAETARLAEEKKKSDALAATAKLQSDAEEGAKRQLAEADRLAREKATAEQKELEERQRKAAEVAAKQKADEEAKAKVALAAAPAIAPPDSKPTIAAAPSAVPAGGEMTNSIGMVLVLLPSGLWVGKYEVTQAEYRRVMGANPSKSKNDRQPVEWVTLKEANDFCQELTKLERAKLPAGNVYTLPTQEQWKQFSGDQKLEQIPGGVTGKSGPSAVGQSGPPNKLGLYDVLGNVWEWCLDAPEDTQLRGGAFNSANYEQPAPLSGKGSNCGFRCVITAP